MRVAIIGTRFPGHMWFELLSYWAEELAEKGVELSTGGAIGSDEACMQGAAKVDPSRLHIFLPWKGFNTPILPKGSSIVVYERNKHRIWTDSVKRLHPNYARLSNGARCLHARNYGIVAHPDKVDAVIALPKSEHDWGGTGQGMRVAYDLDIPVYNLRTPGTIDKVEKFIAGL